MVRLHKMFGIDKDLIDNLSRVNASQLVNDLLHEHFGSSRDKLSREKIELTNKLKEIEEEDKELQEIEIEQTRQGEIQERMNKAKEENKQTYERVKQELTTKAKNKEITFEVYMKCIKKLKKKMGII